MDDVIINKAATIERCLQRIKYEYKNSGAKLATDFTRQDALILNLLRACEAALDMATHTIRTQKLGVPQTSRESFVLLEQAKIIPVEISSKLQAMVGFRNIAVHNYMELNLDIVQNVIEKELNVFLDFNRCLLAL